MAGSAPAVYISCRVGAHLSFMRSACFDATLMQLIGGHGYGWRQQLHLGSLARARARAIMVDGIGAVKLRSKLRSELLPVLCNEQARIRPPKPKAVAQRCLGPVRQRLRRPVHEALQQVGRGVLQVGCGRGNAAVQGQHREHLPGVCGVHDLCCGSMWAAVQSGPGHTLRAPSPFLQPRLHPAGGPWPPWWTRPQHGGRARCPACSAQPLAPPHRLHARAQRVSGRAQPTATTLANPTVAAVLPAAPLRARAPHAPRGVLVACAFT